MTAPQHFGGRTDEIDQIELRWKQGLDFGPIAFSGETQNNRTMWERWLNGIGAVADADDDEHMSGWSCVYLAYGNQAAFLWRTSDRGALPISRDFGERHALVARALVGPSALLTPRMAIALADAEPPPGLLGPRPGQVKELAVLPRVPVDRLQEIVRSAEAGLSRRARCAPGLNRLIAKVLEAPANGLSVVVPEHDAAPVLLWGLLEAAGAMLSDGEGRAAYGWEWSFSTHEPSRRYALTGELLPHLVFRSRRPRGGPYLDLCENDPGGSFEADVATRLLTPYQKTGAEGIRYVFGGVFRRHSELENRMKGVLYEADPDDSRDAPAGEPLTMSPPDLEPPAEPLDVQPGLVGRLQAMERRLTEVIREGQGSARHHAATARPQRSRDDPRRTLPSASAVRGTFLTFLIGVIAGLVLALIVVKAMA